MRPVTQHDVEIAAITLASANDLLIRAGGTRVTETMVHDAQQRLSYWQKALAQISGWRFCLELPTIRYYRAIAAFRNTGACFGWPWYVTAMIAAGCACGVVMLGMLILTESIMANFAVAAFAFLLSFAASAFLLLVPPDAQLTEWLRALSTQRNERVARLSQAHEELSKTHALFKACRQQYRAWQAYENALIQHERLLAEFKSYKNQLKLRDWRSLRGIDFESFLADVFQALGFEAQTTKASGDQGVDLLLRRSGYQIAVQAKGYANSVGTSAVQEVYAGMSYYGCHKCMVVTNSYFTRGAFDLAGRTGCLLVSGEQIADLIEGNFVHMLCPDGNAVARS